MAPRAHPTQFTPIRRDEFQALLQQQMRQAVRLALMAVLEAEWTSSSVLCAMSASRSAAITATGTTPATPTPASVISKTWRFRAPAGACGPRCLRAINAVGPRWTKPAEREIGLFALSNSSEGIGSGLCSRVRVTA